MNRLAETMLALTAALHAATIIDRIAVIVGKQAIKLSDIERELRLTEFLNGQPLDRSPAARKKEADHLIDQAVIRNEIALEGYSRASDTQADQMLDQIRHDRYAGSDARLREALGRYGLTEGQLRDSLRWQMTVLNFIDERFRPAVLITDEQVRSYYDSHLADLRKRHPGDYSFKTLAPRIRNLLEEEQVNELFEQWLDETRKSNRIQFVDGAFQ